MAAGPDGVPSNNPISSQNRTNASSLAGLSTPGYSPRVRIRIKDMFSKNVNSVLGKPGPQLKIPALTLDKTAQVGTPDSPLLAMDVVRHMGVTGGNTATLTFSNKDGAL